MSIAVSLVEITASQPWWASVKIFELENGSLIFMVHDVHATAWVLGKWLSFSKVDLLISKVIGNLRSVELLGEKREEVPFLRIVL